MSPPTGLTFFYNTIFPGLPYPSKPKSGLPGAPVRTWASLVRALRRWEPERQASLFRLAISWCYGYPGLTTPVRTWVSLVRALRRWSPWRAKARLSPESPSSRVIGKPKILLRINTDNADSEKIRMGSKKRTPLLAPSKRSKTTLRFKTIPRTWASLVRALRRWSPWRAKARLSP